MFIRLDTVPTVHGQTDGHIAITILHAMYADARVRFAAGVTGV